MLLQVGKLYKYTPPSPVRWSACVGILSSEPYATRVYALEVGDIMLVVEHMPYKGDTKPAWQDVHTYRMLLRDMVFELDISPSYVHWFTPLT